MWRCLQAPLLELLTTNKVNSCVRGEKITRFETPNINQKACRLKRVCVYPVALGGNVVFLELELKVRLSLPKLYDIKTQNIQHDIQKFIIKQKNQ